MRNNNSGFMLMEILLGLVIFAMIAVTVFPSLGFMLKKSQDYKATLEAAVLVQEGMEVVYNIFNTPGIIVNGNYKIVQDGLGKWALDTGDETNINSKFTRIIEVKPVCRQADGVQAPCTIAELDPKSQEVITTVKWDENGIKRQENASLLLIKLSSP